MLLMLCHLEQLGLVDYEDGLRLQRELVARRKAGTIPDTLLLLEHPHVYTLGRNAKTENLLISAEQLAARGAQVFEIDRGGDVTYHGPGQLVGYPILDLAQHRRDIAWYMRCLEEVLIAVAGEYGLEAGRLAGARESGWGTTSWQPWESTFLAGSLPMASPSMSTPT